VGNMEGLLILKTVVSEREDVGIITRKFFTKLSMQKKIKSKNFF
jgi:hypothetical protein